eukprot:scaffold168_cov147-Skeletonema_dohrnii-CCMP3373.AAC.2
MFSENKSEDADDNSPSLSFNEGNANHNDDSVANLGMITEDEEADGSGQAGAGGTTSCLACRQRSTSTNPNRLGLVQPNQHPLKKCCCSQDGCIDNSCEQNHILPSHLELEEMYHHHKERSRVMEFASSDSDIEEEEDEFDRAWREFDSWECIILLSHTETRTEWYDP